MFFLGAKRTKNARHTGFASRSRLLLVSYHVTSLIRLSLAACVCRSNLGNKRTRFTHSLHRMAHTLRHFCSYSSIGTDTRCCSNGAGFLFNITFCRWLSRWGWVCPCNRVTRPKICLHYLIKILVSFLAGHARQGKCFLLSYYRLSSR
jgi:hypothetical protein